MTNIVNGKGLWKTYDLGGVQINALRGLDITVDKGDFVAIMGPSGSGKSTLMNMIGCLDSPSEGDLYICGKNTCEMSDGELNQIRAEKIGFIFQTFNLLPALSVRDNVEFPMRNMSGNSKVDKKTRRKRAEECLKMVGLEHRLDYIPAKLSGGERQRVAIARALVNEPYFILADEPTGNLDRSTADGVFELMLKLAREQGTAFIVVTHDETLAARCQRQLRLEQGRLSG